MSEQTKAWGGSRAGSGRKVEGRHKCNVMLNKEEQAMLQELGGSAWVRAQITRAYKRLEKQRAEKVEEKTEE